MDELAKCERECIRLLLNQRLLKGKAIKETVFSLQLSPRTVEHYFENIKDKLNCKFKNELLKIAERLEELGLI